MVAEELATRIKRRYYMEYVDVVRKVAKPAEKLLYLYIALFQPQTFSTLRRGLGLHENTIVRALKALSKEGHITQDERYFWWNSSNTTRDEFRCDSSDSLDSSP
jgi:DNA-binding MarR family transcriptional regulator